jgi:RNA polymerase sigma factor (sigma-70 family)
MSRESASQAIRQIRRLHALGVVGGLADAQLVEQFLKSDGDDREDAFAALVQRHGPMVLGVCRRMLRGSADVDDAFQAVFLVLARKARRLSNVERLKPWLYGVAVRTAQEARRRSARRRQREGSAMDESKVASASNEPRSELLDMLDEEITRLPRRYREAVLLCELEGVSRETAARQLGLPEGTLSSRLARGRTILRERLTRRGVTLGAGAIAAIAADPANAALPEVLAHSTVQLALSYAAGGTVPAAISSLAKGVLAMTAAARFKLVLITAVALGAGTGLTAGFTWGLAGKRVDERGDKPGPPAAATVAPLPKAKVRPMESAPILGAQGVVVDEAGGPVDLGTLQVGAPRLRN